MKVFSSLLLPFAALLACCLLLTGSALPEGPKPAAGGAAAPKAAASCSPHKKLGANFTDYTVPKRASATVGESLGFAAIVVGVLAVASVNTYFKVKQSPKLPGYTQAVYLRERDHL